MGNTRNGARSVLNLIAKACKLSRLPGFRSGIDQILGSANSTLFLTAWDALCGVVDVLIGVDNYFNQIDFVEETTGSEDNPAVG